MSHAVLAESVSSNNAVMSRKTCHSSCSDVFYVGSNEKKESTPPCPRCGQKVYPFEKIGPIKGQIYHRVCFKCIVCGRQLDLRTYFTNSDDLDDKQVYCRSHFPKSQRGHVHADNFHIMNVMKAPKPLVIQQLNLPRPTVDSKSVGILHAVNAQNLLHNGKVDQSGYHFPVLPPEIMAARQQIYKLQKNLEIKQKEEEDALYKKFLEDRKREEERIEKELDTEWRTNLRELCQKYENMAKTNEQIDTVLSNKFQQEKKHLQVNLTLKRERYRKSIKECLLEQERHETAELVTKQSKEMLKMIERKQVEIMKARGITVSPRKPPEPKPPVLRKCQLYEDVTALEYIDNLAIQVAESEQDSYTELVEKLTGSLITELEKARAIFRWITVKDLNSMEFSENLTDDTPMGILRGIKYGTETYHTLFMRLCSYAGLYCVNIKGHSKSFGYEPGLPIEEGKFLNTWNAVLIDDEWRFVQCNWGARHLVMCKDSVNSKKVEDHSNSDKIEYEYDEHYFLTDPDEFIFEFFPFEPAWQLLPNPITLAQFEQLPFVRSLFFHYSLDFVNQKMAVIMADERGACDIQLRMPNHLKRDLVFHSQLRRVDEFQGELEFDNIGQMKLENFVLHTVENDIVSFNVHLPRRGIYHLELFANTVDKSGNMFGQTFKLRCVCKYKLICNVLRQRMHALPLCANGEWGPEKAIRHYGWKALSHKAAIIETVYDDLCVLFQLPKRLKVHCKLQSRDATALSKCPPVHVTVDDDNLLIIDIGLVVNAQYGLDIYARDPDEKTERKVMSHCCKYLINRNNSFPHIHIGENNADLTNKMFMPVSHNKPDIELPFHSNSVDLLFMVAPTISLDFCLKFEGDTDCESLPLQDHLSIKRAGSNLTVKLRIPLPGRYLLTIFILIKNGQQRPIPAYTYAVKRSYIR